VALAELAAWRERCAGGLGAPDGWWSVTGLAWLDAEGAMIGAHRDALVRLPDGMADEVARLEVVPEGLRVRPLGGTHGDAELTLDGARLPSPVVVPPGRARLTVVDGGTALVDVFFRGGRWGARTYDPRQGAARDPGDVAWFPPSPGWRVEARVEQPRSGETMAFTDVLGETHVVPLAGRLRFVLAGQQRELIASAAGDDLFVNFRDDTNGASDPTIRTYGAGRFLRVPAPVHGVTVVDFHRAYHPPCAHTAHALCPLPPAENRLPLAVLAGERLGSDRR
jgi:uncharacterized protein